MHTDATRQHRGDRSAVFAKMRAKGLAHRKDVTLHLQGRGGVVLAQEEGLGKWASEELSALLHSVRGGGVTEAHTLSGRGAHQIQPLPMAELCQLVEGL